MNERGRVQRLGALALAALPWFGCSKANDTSAEPQANHVAASEPAALHLTIVDRAGFDAQIERLRGKVVLVDCWATWCVQCVKQLPHTVQLYRQHQEAGLAVILLSLDDPSASDDIRAVLQKNGATAATNLVSEFGTGSESAQVFDIPGGALPHYKLYDRSGKLRRTFALDPAAKRQFTPRDVAAAVNDLLAE